MLCIDSLAFRGLVNGSHVSLLFDSSNSADASTIHAGLVFPCLVCVLSGYLCHLVLNVHEGLVFRCHLVGSMVG